MVESLALVSYSWLQILSYHLLPGWLLSYSASLSLSSHQWRGHSDTVPKAGKLFAKLNFLLATKFNCTLQFLPVYHGQMALAIGIRAEAMGTAFRSGPQASCRWHSSLFFLSYKSVQRLQGRTQRPWSQQNHRCKQPGWFVCTGRWPPSVWASGKCLSLNSELGACLAGRFHQ